MIAKMIVGSDPARTSWLHLWAFICLIVGAPAPMSFSEKRDGRYTPFHSFIHSFIYSIFKKGDDEKMYTLFHSFIHLFIQSSREVMIKKKWTKNNTFSVLKKPHNERYFNSILFTNNVFDKRIIIITWHLICALNMLCKLKGAGHCTSAKGMTSILRHVSEAFPPIESSVLPPIHLWC